MTRIARPAVSTPTTAAPARARTASARVDSTGPAAMANTAATAKPPDASDTPDAREAQLLALGAAFRRVFRGLSRLRGRDTHLGGSALSHAQFELLAELYDRGELPAGELAAAARLTPATVTQMLEHLADQGHVERARSEVDRRVVVSKLTPSGKRKIVAKRKAWQARWEEALDGMGPEELLAATRVLERLGGLFEDVPAEGACPDSSGKSNASS
ncbi:MAG TPA: MarR family winged helix-turn-helix transcriptional regulator [Solirubrobacteraceae bacterium]|nr:MarR family winged helix-turn-helix transcriptional regulator [Solirubrobacteraceae bacterium]